MKTETRHALKHDKFVDQTNQGIEYVSSNLGQVLTAVGVALALIALVIGISIWQSRRAEQASSAFGAAMAVYTAPVAQPGAPPLPGSYPSLSARSAAAHEKFAEVASHYGSSKIGESARYFSGITSIETGNPSGAETDLKAVINSHNHNLANLARVALAGLYQSSKRDNQAADLYQQVVAKPSTTVPATQAELQLAALYEQTSPEKAKELYAKIKDQDKTGAAGQIAAQKLSGKPQQQ